MLKAVIDTNVLICGLINSPSCRKIIRALEKWDFIPVISPEMLSELIEVTARPKFHNIIKRDTATRLIETVKSQALLVRPSSRMNIIKDDPDDNCFLEAAITAKVDCIVSLDNHLLKLTRFRNIPIITPTKFLELLNS